MINKPGHARAYEPRPTSLVATRCTAARRIAGAITTKHKDLFGHIYIDSQYKNAVCNFFGCEQVLGSHDSFNHNILSKGILDADLIDDFLVIGSKSCGAKLVELGTMLEQTPMTSRVNLNLIISEQIGNPEVDPAFVLNALMAFNLLQQLDKKYRRVLSITFISNSELMRYSGDKSLEYKRSNELLAKHFITERQMNLRGQLRLIDLVGRQDSRFSVIGFASIPVKPRAVDNYNALSELAESAKRQLWFKASDMFDKTVRQGDLHLKGGKLIVVIPPAAYAAIINAGSFVKQFDDRSIIEPPSAQLDAEKQAGIPEYIDIGTMELRRIERLQRSKENIPIEIVEGTDKGQTEIYAIYRKVLWPDDVEEFFDYIEDKMDEISRDASTDQPQTILGRKLRELQREAGLSRSPLARIWRGLLRTHR